MVDSPAGGLAFVAMWSAMMTAMMLPSALPTVWRFAAVARLRARPGVYPAPVAAFVAGYLGTCTLMGAGIGLLNAAGGGCCAHGSTRLPGLR